MLPPERKTVNVNYPKLPVEDEPMTLSKLRGEESPPVKTFQLATSTDQFKKV